MRSARHHVQTLLAAQGMAASLIQFEHHRVPCADDLQGRCPDLRQYRPRQIGSPSPADHRMHHVRARHSSQQRRSRTGAGTEQTDAQRTQICVPADPVDHLHQPPGQQVDIEP